MELMQAKMPLRGEVKIPGDKSISHRAVMFGALADGTTRVTNFLQGADCLSTISCFRKLGIDIEKYTEGDPDPRKRASRAYCSDRDSGYR